MNTMLRRIRLWLYSSGCTLLVAACGGGGSAPALSPVPPPVGGIEGSGIAIGTISGFGSIFVNGVRFDTSTANIIVEGQPATEAQLAVGQVVRVSGSFDDNGTTGTADEVRYDDILEGPIASIDLAASMLVVLGQTVVIDAATSFDDSISPAGLEGLNVTDVVEISGFLDAAGTIRATRIEPDDDGDEFEVEGMVREHAGAAMTFVVGTLTVDYSSAILDGFPGGAPENGQFVEVHGSAFGAGGELMASRVEFEDDELDAEDGDEVEIEGLITRFISATDFDVAGQRVTTTATTTFENGSAADIGLDRKVEAEGVINAAGVLVADKIDFRRGGDVEIEATADSADAGAGTVVMLGITVRTDLITRFEDKSDAEVEMFSVANINAGDYLEVRGSESPPDSGEVLASRMERDDLDSEVSLQGFVETVSDPSFTILGVTIETGSGTVFRDANEVVIPAADFFSQVGPGSLVKATGSEVAVTTISATEVEFEN